MQIISRKCTFDSGHRVMNERMKCFNVHGHTYTCILKFTFLSSEEIGYAIDFKEIKRVGLQWIDDYLDHGMILNPNDTNLILTTRRLNSKLWLMSLNGKDKYCNPSAENISKEIFLAMEILFARYRDLEIHEVELYETPNCSVSCFKESISVEERRNWRESRFDEVFHYTKSKGVIEYDDRKVDNNGID